VAPNRTSLKIVVVDDNPDATYTMAMLLERSGFSVAAQVYDAREAVDCIKQHRPRVVIMDIAMPQVDGYEIARQLRAEFGAPLKLVAVSGLGRSCDKSDALEAGFDAHFTKPANWSRLEAFLVSCLEETQPAVA
jgi:CheY-like chemotaxis protein